MVDVQTPLRSQDCSEFSLVGRAETERVNNRRRATIVAILCCFIYTTFTFKISESVIVPLVAVTFIVYWPAAPYAYWAIIITSSSGLSVVVCELLTVVVSLKSINQEYAPTLLS